jgi:peptide/nickel transport system permease protein
VSTIDPAATSRFVTDGGAARVRRGRLPRAATIVLHSPLTVAGITTITVLVLAAMWPVAWLPHDPYLADISLRFRPPYWENGGELSYPLGTDALGRDMLSTIVHGGRFSLSIVGIAALLSLVVGVLGGLVAGFYRGWADDLLMRLVDIQLAFPLIILIIAIVAILGPSIPNLILVLGIAGWAPFARIVRGTVLSLREKEFVEAARTVGASPLRIMAQHLLPNTMTPIIIFTTFDFARLLLIESALSFLGLGIQPPTPSWGGMIADGRQYLFEAWWNSAFPGAVIVMAVLGFNFLGDGLRDALDPLSAPE